MPLSTLLLPSKHHHHLLLQAALSAAAALLAAALRLPSLALHGLHTYIHPDTVAPSDGNALRAAIRRPDAPPTVVDPSRRRPRSSKDHHHPQRPPDFDESSAQLFRLRLVDAHLHTRLFFPSYRAAFLSSVFALSFLALRRLFNPSASASALIPAIASLLSASHLLLSLAKATVEPSASKRSEKQIGVVSGLLGFLSALLIAFSLSPSVFDFKFGGSADPGLLTAAVTALAGCVAGLLFIPSARSARSFWLGTDQLRWNLSVVSCGAFSRVLLHADLLLNVFAPLLWIKPLTVAVMAAPGVERSGELKEFRIWALLAAAVSQLLVLRPNLQMYLNEAVLCWYQRLHASRAPDLDYGRAKVFLHNHYLCLALLQFLVPPVLALMLLGVSQMRGNLFNGVLFIGCLEDCSAIAKEMALFMAWWIVFVRAVLTMSSLAIYRCGFLFVS